MNSLHAHRKNKCKLTTNSSISTLQNPSSSRLGQTPDQDSMRLGLQLRLERLDRLNRHMHKEIQEIRSSLDRLDNCQSDVTMANPGGYDSTVDSQAGLDGPIPPIVHSHDDYFMPQPVSHGTSFGVTDSLSENTGPSQCLLPRSSAEYGPTAQPSLTQPQHSMYPEAFSAFRDPRVTESLSEGADSRLDFSLRGTSNSVYEPAVQPSQSINFEEHVPSSSSARPDEQLSAPVAQVRQIKDKVKCTQYGCSAFVNKDNLTRHVKEVHEGKIKAICPGCGREFKRPYQMNEHILQHRCGRS